MFGSVVEKPEDTCAECGCPEADQLVRDGEIVLYMCSSCGHQWQPYTKVEFGYVVKRKRIKRSGPAISDDEMVKAAKEVSDRFDQLLFSAFMIPRSLFGEEDKEDG